MKRFTFRSEVVSRRFVMVLMGCVTLARGLAAEGNSSLSESKKENADTTLPGGGNVSQGDQLTRQLFLAQESVQTLTDSLAVSNIEVEGCRQKYSDLRLRLEALGIEGANKDRSKLEQRLLTAAADLRAMQKERDRYRDNVLGLSEAVFHLLKASTGTDPQARMEVETQLRRCNEVAGRSQALLEEGATMMDGRVISVKEEWSLVVGDIGSKQGVKIGMPMRVMRASQQIATLRVVDVRQRICGAVMQQLGSERIKVGDRLQADARQETSLKIEK